MSSIGEERNRRQHWFLHGRPSIGWPQCGPFSENGLLSPTLVQPKQARQVSREQKEGSHASPSENLVSIYSRPPPTLEASHQPIHHGQ